MRTALNLLKTIVELGYDQQKALIHIDKILDKKIGIEGRKPLSDEGLSDVVYDEILGFFQKEGTNQDGLKHDNKILCNSNNRSQRRNDGRKTKY